MYLKQMQEEVFSGVMGFFKRLPAALGVGAKLVAPWLTTGTPEVPVQSAELRADAHTLGRLVREFGLKLPHVFMKLKDEATFAQAELVHERIADIAIDLYVSSCVLARLDHMLARGAGGGALRRCDERPLLSHPRLPPHPRALRGPRRQRRRSPPGHRAGNDWEVLKAVTGVQ
jgi:hypothetical protein